MSTATEAVEELWVSKDEAAARMKVKPRQVEKRAQAGYIRKRYQPRKRHERTAHVEYSLADIEAMLNGTPNQHGEPVPDFAAAFERHTAARQPTDGGQALTTALARLDETLATGLWSTLLERVQPREWRAWLTLPEASEYSGLPVPFLSALLREGHIHAIGRGPATWRIQRASLDGYGTAAHQ